MAQAPSDAEFLKWLSPGAALKRLPADWPERTKRDAIMRRIRDNSLVALARSARIRDDRGTRVVSLSQISPRVWGDDWVSEDRDFWTAGDIEFWIPRPTEVLFHVGLDRQPEDERALPKGVFKDVRIEPGSFARAFAGHLSPDEPQPTPASESKDARPTTALPAAEFEQWLRPAEVLRRFFDDVPDEGKKRAVVRRLADGHIRSVARHSVYEDDKSIGGGDFLPLAQSLWAFPWRAAYADFWTTGDIGFTYDPNQHDDIGFGLPMVITADTPPPPPPPPPPPYIVRELLDVRLCPADVTEQFGPARLTAEFENEDATGDGGDRKITVTKAKGGRSSGHHGIVIATIAKRLLALSETELRAYEPRRLQTELIDEYHAHGATPPSAENVALIASGVLKALRN